METQSPRMGGQGLALSGKYHTAVSFIAASDNLRGLCPVLGTFQSAFWYTRPPASQRSNKKQTIISSIFQPWKP